MRPLFPLLPGLSPTRADFVLHARVILPWFDTSLWTTQYPSDLLGRMSRAVAGVPEGWLHTLGTLVRDLERRGVKTAQQSDTFILGLRSFTILVDDDPVGSIVPILNVARTYSLTVPEAAHLELAMRLGVPLAITDRTLSRAANTAGVSIFSP